MSAIGISGVAFACFVFGVMLGRLTPEVKKPADKIRQHAQHIINMIRMEPERWSVSGRVSFRHEDGLYVVFGPDFNVGGDTRGGRYNKAEVAAIHKELLWAMDFQDNAIDNSDDGG